MAGNSLDVYENVIEGENFDKRIAYLKVDGTIQDIGSVHCGNQLPMTINFS